MQRTRTGKRIELTARDLEIFRQLRRYRYLRSSYLHAFAGGASETRFKERLGDLFHEGFLDRPDQQWRFSDARSMPTLYELGEGARRVLCEREEDAEDGRTFFASNSHRQFQHSVLICDCLASIELSSLSRPALRFIPWTEILARVPDATKRVPVPYRIPASPQTSVVPDGLFGLEYRNNGKSAYRFFALEADRGTMPIARSNTAQTSYLAKLAIYREVIERKVHRTHLGVPNLLVLSVTTSADHLTKIMQAFEKQYASHAGFLFKSVGPESRSLSVPSRDLLETPWDRPGFEPLAIYQ
jgi:hypothetical protein